VGEFLVGVLERMDHGPFEISERVDGELVIYELAGTAAAAVGSGEGRTVDAMQLLANQVAMRVEDEPRRVVLEVEGNAEARETLLMKFARRGADRARETGRPVKLDPMNGADRRAIHLALRDEEGVATMSIGEGSYRQVVVVPEGAPDYEDAVRESKRAAADSER
jgi:spoIIIJ-associated protein